MHVSVKALFSLEDGVDATEKASGQRAGLSHYVPSPHMWDLTSVCRWRCSLSSVPWGCSERLIDSVLTRKQGSRACNAGLLICQKEPSSEGPNVLKVYIISTARPPQEAKS